MSNPRPRTSDPGALLHQVARRLAAGEPTTFAELHGLVRDWVRRVDSDHNDDWPGRLGCEPAVSAARRVTRFLGRRRLGQFLAITRTRSPLGTVLQTLFTTARVRRQVMAYLSIQEGNSAGPFVETGRRVERAISEGLQGLGRRTPLQLHWRRFGLRMTVGLDPFSDLRAIYGILTKHRRRGAGLSLGVRCRIRCLRLRYSAKVATIGLVARRVASRLHAGLAAGGGIDAIRGELRRLMAITLLIAFEDATDLSDLQWEDLMARIEVFLNRAIPDLFAALPASAAESHGLGKLAKVAVGVLAGRAYAVRPTGTCPVTYIADSVRLALYWGATYPLIDDVIDDVSCTPERRARLLRSVGGVFEAGVESKAAGASEANEFLIERHLREAAAIVSEHARPGAARIFRLLLAAHEADSVTRLSGIAPPEHEGAYVDSLAIAASKAALVRLCTMSLCGITPLAGDIATAFRIALFNQLGDDLWDVGEDTQQDRVTPFTLEFRSRQDQPSRAFRTYLGHAFDMAVDLPPASRAAAIMGVLESVKDLWDSGHRAGSGPDRWREGLRRDLTTVFGQSALDALGVDWSSVPHVDLDAPLFAVEGLLVGWGVRADRGWRRNASVVERAKDRPVAGA